MNVKRLFAGAPATAALCVACVVIFVVTAAQAGSLTNAIWGSRLGTQMVLYGPFVTSEPFGWLRMFAAGFAHVDATHVAVNVVMLALVAAEVERFVGTAAFVPAYVAGLAGSAAAVLAFNFDTPTVGASGALYMLMVVLIAVAYRRQTDLRAPFALLSLNVLYSLLASGVSLWGHLGGLAVGVVLAAPLTSDRSAVRVAAAGTAAGVAVVLSTLYPQDFPGLLPV